MTTQAETAEARRGVDMDEATLHSLRGIIAVLLEQRGIVVAVGASFAARLLDLAIMQLRLTVNEISEEELSGLSELLGDGLTGDERPN
jgi:hypothetical protein